MFNFLITDVPQHIAIANVFTFILSIVGVVGVIWYGIKNRK